MRAMIEQARAGDAQGSRGSGLPPQAALAWIGIGALLSLLLVAVLLRSPRAIDALEGVAIEADGTASAAGSVTASAVEPEIPALAPSAELDLAKRGGAPALVALAQKYPRDHVVLTALLVAQAIERPRFPEAIETIKALFALRAESASDETVRRVFARLASGPNEIVDAVFELAGKAPGEAGPDLLYEIISTDGPVQKPVKDRAQRLLDTPEMKQKVSAALQIALDLRAASPCARKALFARAAESGDLRALPSLDPLVSTGGCKRLFRATDCYACLGPRAELNAAVAAIKGRSTDKR
jgi:hypothetical protein